MKLEREAIVKSINRYKQERFTNPEWWEFYDLDWEEKALRDPDELWDRVVCYLAGCHYEEYPEIGSWGATPTQEDGWLEAQEVDAPIVTLADLRTLYKEGYEITYYTFCFEEDDNKPNLFCFALFEGDTIVKKVFSEDIDKAATYMVHLMKGDNP
jgi:hypothetical protein